MHVNSKLCEHKKSINLSGSLIVQFALYVRARGVRFHSWETFTTCVVLGVVGLLYMGLGGETSSSRRLRPGIPTGRVDLTDLYNITYWKKGVWQQGNECCVKYIWIDLCKVSSENTSLKIKFHTDVFFKNTSSISVAFKQNLFKT